MKFLSQNFEIKYLGETSCVFDIEINRDIKKKKILTLSRNAYIEQGLGRFRMKHCVPSVAPILKRDKFNKD